ncbi:MAG TPA: hypothetical protein VN613_09800 [Gemmatimonadaceae bacterium]|nr:hypothetical protein [Gemmatimonadaceae bacterium]
MPIENLGRRLLRSPRPARRAATVAGVVLVSAAIACGDPYLHTNPYDPVFPVSVAVVGPDTVYSYSEVAKFTLQTDPAFPDTSAEFSVSDSIAFPPAGTGSFRSAAPPLYPATRSIIVVGGVGAFDTLTASDGAAVGAALFIKAWRHSATKTVVLTQRVVRISLRCPDTHACDTVAVGGAWQVWVDGFDAVNQEIVALHSSVANPASGVPVAIFSVRDPSIVSVSPLGIRAANVTALKVGTTWIVGTRIAAQDTLRDSLQLVVQ